MRLIDADKLKETMMKYYGCENATKYGNETAEQQAHSYSTLMLYEVSDMIEDCIDNAPTVDINTKLSVAYLKGRRQGQLEERPTGKWEFEYENDEEYYFSCTNCNTTERVPTGMNGARYKFCPNCGAKMETKGEEE